MTDGGQAAVAARVPGAGALGLVPPPLGTVVPGPLVADPAWTAERVAELGRRHRSDDRRVLATVWWYSLSAVLVTPPLAGLAAGVPLSARLPDLSVTLLAGGTPVAAVSAAPWTDPAAELRETLGAVVDAVAEAGGVRPAPLWAIATDSIANRLLALGRALGDVAAVTALAGPVAAAVGAPLPAPRYVDVGPRSVRFTRRASCCLLYRLLGEATCTSCPRRTPFERQVLLEDTAERIA
ncbi:(2Fe-2S)-binding protein [Blastococcus sp. TF02A-26]|uniref:(2Fe-2S)-binding protein n=1 Tax=Blastococcus sp. TF02A-26 TaxID=2250577 RepID=UPI000DEB1717|nr:(2Fe-2S)-binding protein [Blastococcus sp. TF02A-26]RBY80518.1 iron reductase [Blastococcus sp. TF02A-26]